jgi:hypothetical protein
MPTAATEQDEGHHRQRCATRSNTVRSPPMSFPGAVAIHAMLAVTPRRRCAGCDDAFCTKNADDDGSDAMKFIVLLDSSPASAPVPAITAYTAMIEGPRRELDVEHGRHPEPAPNALDLLRVVDLRLSTLA